MEYNSHYYFYRVGCWVPKDKIVHLTYEGGYCGRVNGDKEQIIVTWDGSDFVVLDHAYGGDLRTKMARFKGLTPAEGIALVQKEEQERQAYLDSLTKCKYCGERAGIRFENDQPDDVCLECFQNPSKSQSKSKSEKSPDQVTRTKTGSSSARRK